MRKIEIRREGHNRTRIIIEDDNRSYIVKILNNDDVKTIENFIIDVLKDK